MPILVCPRIVFAGRLGLFPLVLSAWNEKHWLKPELVEQPELLQVKLILTVETKEIDSLVPNDGIKDGIKELLDNQTTIIRLIMQDGTITSAVLAQKTGLSQRTLMRELPALQKKGLLVKQFLRIFAQLIKAS